jgi:hypothetical protein
VNTIIETNTFTAKPGKVWTAQQYEEFVLYIAINPRAGKIVPGTGGVKKVRWVRADSGKSGGVRVIYFNTSLNLTWLLTIYGKNERETIPAHELKKIKEAING